MATKIINSLTISDTYVFSLPYGTCDTGSGVAAKTVTVDKFALETGAQVIVTFTNANTATNATLNVNSTGAKAIYYQGAAVSATAIKAKQKYQLIYDGTNWNIVGYVAYVTAGSSTVPVYSVNGVPIACTSLSLNTSGNAATASEILYPKSIESESELDSFIEANKFKVSYWNGFTPTGSQISSNGVVLSGGYASNKWGFQLAIDDDPTHLIQLRHKDGTDTGWNAWKKIPMADGTGASGTWGINISGSASYLGGEAKSSFKQTWGASAGGSYTGWIKLIEWNINTAGHFSTYPFLFNIYRNYNSPATESYLLAINGNWGGANITLLNGSYGGHIIEQFRISCDSTQKKYWLEMYVNTGYTTYENSCTCTVFGYYSFNGTLMCAKQTASATSVNTVSTIYGIAASAVHGAVWNDYAEFRNQIEEVEPGYCATCGKDGKLYKATERLQYCEGIVSDTFGFSIGETDECKTPLAVSGRVLAYYAGEIEDYNIGDAVCANYDGKITKMTREEIREYPERILGTVSEIPTYEIWGDGKVSTQGRIWIKIR